MKVKLKVKLIAVVSLIIVVLSVVLASISCVTNYNSSVSMLNDFIPKVVNSTSLAIGNRIGEYISSVEALSKDAAIISAPSNEERIRLLNALKRTEFHAFGYVDQKGNLLSTNGEAPADMRFLEVSLGGSEYFSEPFKDEHEDLLLGLVSYPVVNASGTVQGVLFGTFDFAAICDIVKSTSVSANTSPTIYNKEGTLMAYGDKQLVIDGYNLYTQWLDLLKDDTIVRQAYGRALEGQQSLEYLDVDGEKIVFAYAPVPHTSWSYNFYVPVSDFMGSFYTSLRINILAAVLLLAVSIVFVSFYGARLTRPIESLRQRIVSLSQGDLHSPFQVERSKDELEELSEALAETIQQLNGSIADITSKLKSIGDCDLNLQYNVEYRGDFQEIGNSFQTITGQLNDIFSAINDAARQVTSGSEQVSSGAQALSEGATQQASATQQLAATISEVSSQVKSNAEHAAKASSKAGLVGDEMVQSNQMMQQLIQAMTEISESSGQIGKIIKTIEDIAFQTNILALNAAVEAARAGAAGKGFAVVADEVRNLANKSSEASKNTSSMIENSLRAVENGTKIADDTAKAMLSAVEGAKDVSSTIDMISEASKAQAESIAQISQGIDQIASVIQTNSATAEQSAAASQELTDQAKTLKALVGRFKVDGEVDFLPMEPSASSEPMAYADPASKY